MGIEPTCKTLITETLEMTKLTGKEQKEIEAELRSHFAEQDHHLQLEGYSAKERKKIMKSEFGDPQLIGKQFHIAHRKLDQIPLIGHLLYYTPVRLGVILFFLEVVRNVGARLFDNVFGFGPLVFSWSFEVLDGATFQMLYIPCFVCIGICEGIYLRRKNLSFGECINTIVVAITPFVLYYIFANYSSSFLPSRLIRSTGILINFVQWILAIFIPILLGYLIRLPRKTTSK